MKHFVILKVMGSDVQFTDHAVIQTLLEEELPVAISLPTDNALETISSQYASAILQGRIIAFVGNPVQFTTDGVDQGLMVAAKEVMSKFADATCVVTSIGTVTGANTETPVVVQEPEQKTLTITEDQMPPQTHPDEVLTQLMKDDKFAKILASVHTVLSEKDKRYGNAALQPVNIFTGKTKVGHRIDDKLARIKNNPGPVRKNDVFDIIGYCVLVCVENGWDDFSDQLD